MRLACLNAGCKLASNLDLEAFLEDAVDVHWDMLFVTEFCAWSDSLCLDTCTVQGYTVFKHYPGEGSHCLAFVVCNSILPSVASVHFLGRAGIVALRIANSQFPLSVVGLHGAHSEEITQSLSGVAQLLRSATN